MFSFIKKRDWIQIWNISGTWTSSGRTVSHCHFMIDWSESRHKFRLRVDGDDPKSHSLYGDALETLTKLNRQLFNDPQIQRDKKLKELGI